MRDLHPCGSGIRVPRSVNHGAVGADQADVLNCALLKVPRLLMRSMLAATLIFLAAGACTQQSAQAQMTPPINGIKPKPVATVPIRPALQTPADTANSMAQAER